MWTSNYSLTVLPGSPLAEVNVVSGHLDLVAKGLGYSVFSLPPGIYAVRILCGSKRWEQAPFILDQDTTVAPPDDWNPTLETEAPLLNSASHHEYQSYPAKELSHKPIQIGSGSALFLFVRTSANRTTTRLTKRKWQPPAISVRNRDDKIVAALGGEMAVTEPAAYFSALNLLLDPGYYRIRREGTPATEIGVWLPSSRSADGSPWQTQVFITDSPHSPGLALSGCSILMSPLSTGFDPNGRDANISEQARQVVMSGRRRLSPSFIADVADNKYHNPLIGIYALLMLLRHAKPPQDQVDEILTNTSRLLGDTMPDIQVLQAYHSNRRHNTGEILYPPMLAGCREHFNRLAESDRPRVATDSLFARALPWMLGSCLWSEWQKQFRDRDSTLVSMRRRIGTVRQRFDSVMESSETMDSSGNEDLFQIYLSGAHARIPNELKDMHTRAAESYQEISSSEPG